MGFVIMKLTAWIGVDMHAVMRGTEQSKADKGQSLEDILSALWQEAGEDCHIYFPTLIGLFGWDILNMPQVFEEVTYPSRALPPRSRTIDSAWSAILLLKFNLL